MIARIWHGWTTLENEMAYQTILLNEVIPGIKAKNLPGFRKMQVMKRPVDGETDLRRSCISTVSKTSGALPEMTTKQPTFLKEPGRY